MAHEESDFGDDPRSLVGSGSFNTTSRAVQQNVLMQPRLKQFRKCFVYT